MSRRLLFFALLMAAATPCSATPADSFVLITPNEASAAKATDKSRHAFFGKKVSPDGPRITVERPDLGLTVPSPVAVIVRFEQQLAPVDPESLQVHLVKLIPIDITGRIQPFATVSGIKAERAEVPSGTHTIRVRVSDTDGRLSEKEFEFTVAEAE